MIERIVEILNKLSRQTEIVFTSIAESYPLLLEEVKQGKSIDFGFNAGLEKTDCRLSKGLQEPGIASILDTIRLTTDYTLKKFTQAQQDEEAVLVKLSGNIRKIIELQSIIENIINISQELKVLALNTTIYALNTGKEGGGFSIITQELKKSTDKIIQNAVILTEKRQEINSSYSVFSNDAQRITESEMKSFKGITDNISEILDKIISRSNQIPGFLTQLFDDSDMIKPPLFAIMENIQNQDIMRQAIDQIILSLSGIEVYEGSSPEEKCDELYFVSKTVEIGIEILKQVDSQNQDSITVFETNLNAIESIISELQTKEKKFFKSFVNDENTGFSHILEEVKNSIKMLDDFINNSVILRSTIIGDSSDILISVGMILKSIDDIIENVGELKNISVVARIEVARQTSLAGMDQTVTEMGDQITEIEIDSNKALKDAVNVDKETLPVLKTIEEISERLSTLFSDYNDCITSNSQAIYESTKRMELFLETLTLFSDNFFKLFKKSKHELDSLRDLSNDIFYVLKDLEKIKEDSEIELKTNLESIGKTEWNLKNKKFIEIIEKFTISAHKKQAGEITGLSVEEEHANEGEVTFF